MCGIVGLFLKDRSLEPRLGALLTDMLVTMTDRGPDSAGIAIYGGEAAGSAGSGTTGVVGLQAASASGNRDRANRRARMEAPGLDGSGRV